MTKWISSGASFQNAAESVLGKTEPAQNANNCFSMKEAVSRYSLYSAFSQKVSVCIDFIFLLHFGNAVS